MIVYAETGANLVFNTQGASIDGLDRFKEENIGDIYADPLFEGTYSDDADRRGMDFAEKFILEPDSPAYGACSDRGFRGNDFFGNPYTDCIGFYCGVGRDDR